MNTGKIIQTKNYGTVYYKVVNWNKAVLWKDGGEISLPKKAIQEITDKGIKKIIFRDVKKNEIHIFETESAKLSGVYKVVGQEEQLYFPIQLGKVVSLQN